MAAPRNVTPLIARIRDFFLQRRYNDALRFEGHNLSKRTQPPPTLPEGPSHKLAENYYYTRDGRGETRPPTRVYDPSKHLLTSAASQEAAAPNVGPVTAGIGYNWDTGKSDY